MTRASKRTLFRTLGQFGRKLLHDKKAIAMIETAVTMPTLMVVSFGGLEIANLMVTHTRVSGIALSAADNASRIAAGSNLALPQVREVDVRDVFTGAQLQSGNLDLNTNGRLILSSLEVNATGGQWIHWQRCYGSKNYPSTYGAQGTGIVGNGYAGMGEAGREVKAGVGAPVMFVEVFYDYQPAVFASFIGTKRIRYTAAFGVRDARDTTAIFNPAPAQTILSCL